MYCQLHNQKAPKGNTAVMVDFVSTSRRMSGSEIKTKLQSAVRMASPGFSQTGLRCSDAVRTNGRPFRPGYTLIRMRYFDFPVL